MSSETPCWPSAAPCGNCADCKANDENLLEQLGKAEQANIHARPCQVCDALEAMSEPARVGVTRALAGTIGERTLAEILTSNGYPTGRRAVARHRLEGHS